MSNYALYGSCLIENDATMKDFAISLIKTIPDDDLIKRSKAMEDDGEDPTYEDEYMDRVREVLEHDISRTDINYEELMCRYAYEIGPVLYEIDNYFGLETAAPDIVFFGSKTGECFNYLVYRLIWFIKFAKNVSHPYFQTSDKTKEKKI